MPYKQKGITLLEIILVIGIISLLGAFSVPAFRNFNETQLLENSASDLKNALRNAQSKASSNIKCSTGKAPVRFVFNFNPASGYKITPWCDTGNGVCAADSAVTSQSFTSNITVTQVTPSCTPTSTSIIFQPRGVTQSVCQNTPGLTIYPTNLTLECGGVQTDFTNLSLTLTNSATNKTKTINITPGGTIGDLQQ